MPPSAQPVNFSIGESLGVERLEDIEVVLAEMWKADPDSTSPQIRVCLGNVAVVSNQKDNDRVVGILDKLGIRRPSRVIAALVNDAEPGPEVRASIRAICHLTGPGEPQVCCEQIQLALGPAGTGLLPGVIVPLLEPDLPTVIWWQQRLGGCENLLRRLLRNAQNIVVDFDDPTNLECLTIIREPRYNVEIHDLAWHRTEPWRRAIAHVFNDAQLLPLLKTTKRVKIESSQTSSEQPPMTALLLVGWLCAQLNWETAQPFSSDATGSGVSAEAKLNEGGRGDHNVRFQVEKASDSPATASGPGFPFESICLEFDDESEVRLTLDRAAQKIILAVESPISCPLRHSLNAIPPAIDEIIGRALESTRTDDPVYTKALQQALELRSGGH